MPYFGDFLIFAATGLSLASLIAYIVAWRGRDNFIKLGRRFFQLTTLSLVLALGVLMYLILTHDFRVAYVFSYSSTDLPIYYLWSSLWGGQEGTFLLWVMLAGIMGVIMQRFAGPFEKGNMVFLNLFVLSIMFILLKKSPFEFLPVFRTEGAGLNPLLQNYWMTIHPPVMFVGFAAAVIPFCFAMTALVERRYHTWSEAARRWTLFAWSALGVALVMGGYWAYETLGWGGFWAWDPVENSSLIPWLFLGAQVHTLFIKRRRSGLLRFSMVVTILSFLAVVYGTFLTRSGVLADFSVHSFVDLGINQFLVGGLFFFVLMSAGILIWRWRDISPEPSYSSVSSRAYLVTLGILIFSLGGVLVMIGTSAPLLTRVMAEPSNVGLPYYFNTMTPIAVAVLLLLGLFPAFEWNRGVIRPRLLSVGAAAALTTVASLLVTDFTTNILYLLLFGFAAWALVSNSYVIYRAARERKLKPAYISHIGLALALIGAAVSAGFTTSRMVTMPQGQPMQVGEYTMTFTDVVNTPKGFDCHLAINDGRGTFLATLPHEFPKNAEGVMRKPHVENYLTHDLYLSPVSFKEPEVNDEGVMTLLKGETKSIDRYDVTFHEFDVTGHGEMGANMTAAANLTVRYDGRTEEVAPSLQVSSADVTPITASFADGQGEVFISAIDPDNGGVQLTFRGDFLPAPSMTASVLVVEVSDKPLIALFWFGAIITFFGGGLSMVRRRRRRRNAAAAATEAPVQSAMTQDVA